LGGRLLTEDETVVSWLDGLRLNRFHYGLMLLVGSVELFSGYNSQIIAYTLPQIMRDWRLNPVLGGTLSSYTFMGFMVGTAVLGAVADRIGRKRALMLAVTVFALFGGLAGLARGFFWFAILRFLAGIGMGGALPIAIALVSEYAPARARGKAVTIMACGFNLGWAVAALGGMLIVPTLGWRAALLVGMLPLLLLPLFWLRLPESVQFLSVRGRYLEALREVRRLEAAAGTPPREWGRQHFAFVTASSGSRARDIFGSGLAPTTLLLWITYFFAFLAVYGLSIWLPSLLLASGFSVTQGYGLGMFQSVCAVGGGLVSGLLMDRWGRKPVLAGYYLLGGAALCLLAAVSSGLAWWWRLPLPALSYCPCLCPSTWWQERCIPPGSAPPGWAGRLPSDGWDLFWGRFW
jgi:AAHS family benzoate transporter-like MFS transporter